MNNKQFSALRKRLEKTQKQMAQLLGVSIKAIHSYEQGWRSIPMHVERQLYFLLYRKFFWEKWRRPLLDHPRMPQIAAGKVSGVGVSYRRSMLVYQRHHL